MYDKQRKHTLHGGLGTSSFGSRVAIELAIEAPLDGRGFRMRIAQRSQIASQIARHHVQLRRTLRASRVQDPVGDVDADDGRGDCRSER